MAFRSDFALIGLSMYSIMLIVSDLVSKWSDLPENIPSHFNANGEPDRESSKYILFISPILAFAAFTLLAAAAQAPAHWCIPVKVTDENREEVYNSTKIFYYVLIVIFSNYLRTINATLIRSKPATRKPFVTFIVSFFVVCIFYCLSVAKFRKSAPKAKAKEVRSDKTNVNGKRKNNKKKRV